jgi:RNA recognition motif-containing protein
MGKRLYVGNLSYRMSAEELGEVFSQVGPVTNAAIITDRETGRSKGFGFVEMEEDEDAAAAITQFNGTQVDGRTIKVAEANPRPPRSPRPGRHERPRSNDELRISKSSRTRIEQKPGPCFGPGFSVALRAKSLSGNRRSCFWELRAPSCRMRLVSEGWLLCGRGP